MWELGTTFRRGNNASHRYQLVFALGVYCSTATKRVPSLVKKVRHFFPFQSRLNLISHTHTHTPTHANLLRLSSFLSLISVFDAFGLSTAFHAILKPTQPDTSSTSSTLWIFFFSSSLKISSETFFRPSILSRTHTHMSVRHMCRSIHMSVPSPPLTLYGVHYIAFTSHASSNLRVPFSFPLWQLASSTEYHLHSLYFEGIALVNYP